MQIGVVNSSKLSDVDVAFMVAACDPQAAECASAWMLPRWPVVVYQTPPQLAVTDFAVIEIVDSMDQPGALGFHTDEAGAIFGRVLAQDVDGTCITLSHEVLEMICDPTIDEWRDRGDGTSIALEVADPVEGDSYQSQVTIDGATRTMWLSNYVLPGWFGGAGPFDKMGRVTQAWAMTSGGYIVVRDSSGNESDMFARRARVVPGGLLGAAKAWEKYRKPNGRLSRRLRG